MRKTELFEMYKRRLAWVEECINEYGMEKRRGLDQAYGYTQGITACNEKYFEEITEIWEKWRTHILWEE